MEGSQCCKSQKSDSKNLTHKPHTAAEAHPKMRSPESEEYNQPKNTTLRKLNPLAPGKLIKNQKNKRAINSAQKHGEIGRINIIAPDKIGNRHHQNGR